MKIHKGGHGNRTKPNGPYIKKLMDNKAMRMDELARLAGFAPKTMKRIIESDSADIDHIQRIADTLNVPIVEITLCS